MNRHRKSIIIRKIARSIDPDIAPMHLNLRLGRGNGALETLLQWCRSRKLSPAIDKAHNP
jgi:hypothetical protein